MARAEHYMANTLVENDLDCKIIDSGTVSEYDSGRETSDTHQRDPSRTRRIRRNLSRQGVQLGRMKTEPGRLNI